MENLSNIGTIKEILVKNGFTFSKALGQNFLINPTVCPRMAEMCGADKESGVLEIGPGIGVLTNELAKTAKKVVAIELDKRLLPVLNQTLSDHSNVKIINGDVLKVDLKELISREFGNMRVVVCANLPYYITSPVIMTLLEGKLAITEIEVMVQQEAAERLCAELGSREAGAVTFAVNYYGKAEILFNVGRECFMPSPKVDSSVIRIAVREKPEFDVKNEKQLFTLVKCAFAQRRKTLVNSLANSLGKSKTDITNALSQLGIEPNVRAENLRMEDYVNLADLLFSLWQN